MFAFDFVLAMVLLTAPPDDPGPAVAPRLFAYLQPALQSLALRWEILDPREVRTVLVRANDLPADLKMLRRRYHDLIDAPLVDDALRFPEPAVIGELLAFNRSYRQHLEARLSAGVMNTTELSKALEETDRLYKVWSSLRDAHCDSYYVTLRRHALKQLRELVGVEAYFCGTLPPHVPVWRFQRID
jgi:hypothetical protein